MSSLTDFIQGAIDANTLTISGASHGTAIIFNPTTIRYTPNTSYSGADTFNVIINCDAEPVNITVSNPPLSNITIIVQEQADPYADANAQIKINTVVPSGGTMNGTSTSLFPASNGSNITIEAFCEAFSLGGSPNLSILVQKNGVDLFPIDNTPAIPGASIVKSFTIDDTGASYTASIITTASGSPGYTIANRTGSNIDYDIYNVSSVLTSSGTLNNTLNLNIETLITGGSNSEIRFKAPLSGTYIYADPPTNNPGTSGVVTSGNVFLSYTVASIAAQHPNFVGRIITYTP